MKKLITVLLLGLLVSATSFGGIFDFLTKGKKEEVKIAYVEWACATASSNVMKAALESRLDVEVDLTPVSAAAMFSALGSGDQDAITTAWLPVTHEDYIGAVEDSVEDLGPNFHGAQVGLVVPEYVTIDSIPEIVEHKDKFKGKIIGIDPGAGMMKAIEKAQNENKSGLAEMEVVEGSGATMTAALQNAIKKDEWVVVLGWAPHWKFARWDLKFLKDPDGVYPSAETINTVVRKGLKEDMPEVYNALDNFYWEADDIGKVMLWNTEKGANVEETAKRWVEENPEKVDKWFN